MLKLSRNLLESMDRFALERSTQLGTHPQPAGPRRKGEFPREREMEYAEVSRS